MRFIAVLLLLASACSAAPIQEQTTSVDRQTTVDRIVDTFRDRCLARQPRLAAFQSAGPGLKRDGLVPAALAKLKEQRPPGYEQYDGGLLEGEVPLTVVVSSAPTPAGLAGGCEVIWSGDFPKELPDVIEQRLDWHLVKREQAQGGIVRVYRSSASAGVLVVGDKQPLHSIGKFVPLQ